MSFRFKTLLGISVIQAVFLAVLIFNVLNFLESSNENQIEQRAQTTDRLFANSVTDAIIALDLATMESIIESVMQDTSLLYAQVLDVDNNILAETVFNSYKPIKFQEDKDFSRLDDDVFDSDQVIEIGGIQYGKVRVGFDINYYKQLIGDARSHSISIALVQLLIVAMFSLLLGVYLSNRLGRLSNASEKIASGDYGYQVEITGNDEIAKTIKAFNLMSTQVKEQIDLVQEKNTELTYAKNLAEASSRAKTDFLSIMSHELKTPLNSVIGFSELLENAENLYQEQKEYLYEIKDSGHKLSSLVSAVLELSNIDNDTQTLLQEININDLVNQSMTRFNRLSKAKNISIKSLNDKDVYIISDYAKLSKCIDHLLSNAINYNIENGVVEIDVSIRDFVEINITDTGRGLSQTNSKKAFDAFERLQFGKEGSISGAGVGLTITKKLIESLGGEISVQSEVLKGSVFTLKIPKND